jgi:hypothetical protein
MSTFVIVFAAQIGLPARLIILGLNAWVLYWWFKRQHKLDRLGRIVRVTAITIGVAAYLIGWNSRGISELNLLRFIIMPASLLTLVFLFFPDASYYVAEGLRALQRGFASR